MAKITVQADAITIRPASYDEAAGTLVNIEYKLNGEVIYVVEDAPIGDGLDVNLKVEFDVTNANIKYKKPN